MTKDMAVTVNKWLLILAGIGLLGVVGVALERSSLGDQRRETRPLRDVGERIEGVFEDDGIRAALQIRRGGNSVHVGPMLLDETSVDCVIGEGTPEAQERAADGTYDGVDWACSAASADASLLDRIEQRLTG